jgi:hypothetical protein
MLLVCLFHYQAFSFPTLCPRPRLAFIPGIPVAVNYNVSITRTTDTIFNHLLSITVVHSINEWLPRRLGATSAIIAGVWVCSGTQEVAFNIASELDKQEQNQEIVIFIHLA